MMNGLPWKQTQIILSFLRLHPSTSFQTLFVDYDGYSISSKGYLPSVVYIMVICNGDLIINTQNLASSKSSVDVCLIPGLGRSTGEVMGHPLQYFGAFFLAHLVRNLPAMWKTWVQSLGW